MKKTRRYSCPLRPLIPAFAIHTHHIGQALIGHHCKDNEQKRTIANKSLAANKVFGYSAGVAANSAPGLGNSETRCTAPRKRFFCARFMASCAGETFASAGYLVAGLPTPKQFATQSLGNEVGELHKQGVPTMKTLSLPIAAKIKRGRIAAHKAMARAALHADSSLSTRLNRYNDHMSKARAIAGGSL